MAERGRTLADLGLRAREGREARITGLSIDSRTVRDGHLFAALPGSAAHGAEFITYALRQGAAIHQALCALGFVVGQFHLKGNRAAICLENGLVGGA